MASSAGSVENGSMVQVDEAQIRGHVDEVVRKSVEDVLIRGSSGIARAGFARDFITLQSSLG